MEEEMTIIERLSDIDSSSSVGSSALPYDATLSGAAVSSERLVVSFPAGQLAVVVYGVAPSWLDGTILRLDDLLNLPDGWDSYGSRRVDPNIAGVALRVLDQILDSSCPVPSIVPTHEGRLQFEWHKEGIDLELEILSPTRLFVSYECDEPHESVEQEIPAWDLSLIQQLLRSL